MCRATKLYLQQSLPGRERGKNLLLITLVNDEPHSLLTGPHFHVRREAQAGNPSCEQVQGPSYQDTSCQYPYKRCGSLCTHSELLQLCHWKLPPRYTVPSSNIFSSFLKDVLSEVCQGDKESLFLTAMTSCSSLVPTQNRALSFLEYVCAGDCWHLPSLGPLHTLIPLCRASCTDSAGLNYFYPH